MTSYLFNGNERLWMPRIPDDDNEVVSECKQKMHSKNFPAESYSMKKWNLKDINRLLRLYGSHFCLWNAQNADNRVRNLRNAAYIDITAAMGGNLNHHQVKNKINVLRATYRYEKRRINARIKKGAGAKTKLKWFFLADNFLRRLPEQTQNQWKSTLSSGNICSDQNYQDELPVYITNSEASEEASHQEMPTNEQSVQFFEFKDKPKEVCNFLDFTQGMKKPESKNSTKSLKFIEQLRNEYFSSYRADNLNLSTEIHKEILQRIMSHIKISPTSLKKRLRILTKMYTTEKLKMLRNQNHKPPAYSWWTSAESFFENIEHLQNNSKIIQNSNNSTSSNTVSLTSSSSTTTPTKIILNGLQDDLVEGKWALRHSIKFLRLYGVHQSLWNLRNPDYRSREMRNAAIEDIAAAMGYNLSPERVAKKIKIFRITYMQHRKRMLLSTKLNKPIQVQLRWFPLADIFLRPHIGLQSIQLQDQAYENPQFDLQAVYAALNLIDPELITKF